MFSPLNGERSVDTEVVTEALARLRESDPVRYTFEFDRFDGTRGVEGREPKEIIVICVDHSSSMGESAAFPDMQGSAAATRASQLSRVYL